MAYTFGIISEGITDQAVLERLLVGYFNNPDLDINPLQPARDNTDKNATHGTWSLVFEYCQTERFRQAFEDNDFIVIQIDTDICANKPFDIDSQGSNELTEDFIKRVQSRFIGLFNAKWGDSFCAKYFHRILFAIAVNELECWLLPLYMDKDNQKNKSVGCKETLERKLQKGIKKEYRTYLALAQPYLKQRTFQAEYVKNESLKFFVEKELACKSDYYNYFSKK